MAGIRSKGFFALLLLAALAIGWMMLSRAPAVALPVPAPPPDVIDWSTHSLTSHIGAAVAIQAALAAGTCKPDFRVCTNGNVYLVCWRLSGEQNGIVPLVPNGSRWTAKSAFWAGQDYIQGLFEMQGCSFLPPLAIGLIDWEDDDE